MPTTNDVTKDRLVSKAATDAYRSNYDKIFGGKNATRLQERVSELPQQTQSKEAESKE